MLELGEEVLDQVARLIQVSVVIAPVLSGGMGRNDDTFARPRQRRDYPLLSIVSPVGNDGGRRRVRQQRIGAFQVVRLARSQMKRRWIAQGISRGVNLVAQPAPTAPDRLGLGSPFFAPALC